MKNQQEWAGRYMRGRKTALMAQYAANWGNSAQRAIKNYQIILKGFSNSFPLTP
ncbi:hypothetical protein [Acetobacter senegalensis]|uniref:hypothetical protein n=1 Tax=Acetobacter senegalensis TaxID=446692 RepID=UPI001592D3A8|nr:hypothetical protein [Acetobacter senegalensis]